MRNTRKASWCLGTLGALALVGLTSSAAFADYAPTSADVVGVGSDTVQYASDFIADGDHLGDLGYNAGGNVNRLVNFDATPDANARLAYGNAGVGSTTTALCAPGTGSTAGTGNATATHIDAPCALNPTIVMRAGTNPVLRPNGTGAGYDALLRDNSGLRYIDYSRASQCEGAGTGCRGKVVSGIDSIQIGNDPLQMLVSTSPATHAVPLTAAQLKAVYECTVTTWNDAAIGGSSGATIIPIIPQVGSGTRSSFLAAINVTTPGPCVKTGEENDPTAIAAQASPADAIEPMSGGRLNLYLGKLGTGGSNNGASPLPYFQDPSCPLKIAAPSACLGSAKNVVPAVALQTSGFSITRPLYVYFRDADVNSTTPFQPGSTLNWVRTLFYNPCIGSGCTGFGPGGAPYYASSAGQALISAAGISPTYVPALNGP